LAARVRRVTENAVIALEIASLGHRPQHHLRRAQEAVAVCQSAFRILYARGQIDVRVFDEARRRIEQVVVGLDRLSDTPEKDWSSAKLPPLEAPFEQPAVPQSVSAVRDIVVEVSEIERAVNELIESAQASDPAMGQRLVVRA
jgi:hypothetical protein